MVSKFALILPIVFLLGAALANPAVGILYQRTAGGDLVSTCTVSIVVGEDVGVEDAVALVTAAHCVSRELKYDPGGELWRDNADWLVTFDEKAFTAAATHRVGNSDLGYDIAVLVFTGPPPADVVPLRFGDWATVELGDRLLNWANPLGIGVQRFEGYISLMSLERPVKGANIWWRGNAMAIIPGAGGSSGSLLLDADGDVVGVLIGVIQASFGSPFVVFVPVNKFDAFLTNAQYGRIITR